MARKKQSIEYSDLVSSYRSLAKKADTRLLRIENLSKEPGFRAVKQYAYKNAMRDIKSWSGEKATRFNTAPPKRIDELRSKIRDIESFLSKVSSRVGGIKSVYRKRARTLNKRYDTNFTWQDLGKFFESPEFEKWGNENSPYTFGSKTYVMAVGELERNEEQLVEALKNNQPINLDIKDEKVKDAIDVLLSEYGTDFKKLYKR